MSVRQVLPVSARFQDSSISGHLFGALAPLTSALALIIPLSGTPVRAQNAAELSPKVLQQIQAIADEKAQRTPAQKKIDSVVLHAARAARGEAPVPGALDLQLSQLNAAGLVQPDNTILVDITTTDATALAAQITSLGGTVIASVPQFDSVRAKLSGAIVETVAAAPSVKSIRRADVGFSDRMPAPEGIAPRPRSENLANGLQANIGRGSTVSEGVAAHGADIIQNAGIKGAPSKVCVVSDGINSLAAQQQAGELPAVAALQGQAGSGDEGTSMLELIADMLPGATGFSFATAQNGPAQTAQNILYMRNTIGCEIIVDDWNFMNEAVFQDDVFAKAITSVVSSGAMYFVSAGNQGHLTGRNSGTWEGDFYASPSNLAVIGGGIVHSYGEGSLYNYNTLTSLGRQISLKWSDPVGASSNDYDLYLVSSDGSTLISVSSNTQDGTQDPLEVIDCPPVVPATNPPSSTACPVGSRIYIKQYSGVTRALRLDTHRGRLNWMTSGATYGHHGTKAAISVAAVATPTGRQFNSADVTETYSSDGYRYLFLNPVPSTAPLNGNCVTFSCVASINILAKVDITASDCVSTTITNPTGFDPFCGTSAAAPQAAAIAALIKNAFPGISNDQVFSRMKGSAIDIMSGGPEYDSGWGIVMANIAAGKTPHDFSGDAKSDILWRNTSGEAGFWFMDRKKITGTPSIGVVPNTWSIVGQRDFDGDGINDILWRNSNGDVVIWFMSGSLALTKSTPTIGNVPNNWTVVGTADFDGDGKADILWRNANGDLGIWFMNGATVLSAPIIGNVPTNWSVMGTADFNGDGKRDILWRNTANDVGIWLMNGATILSAPTIGNVGPTWSVVGLGDFDADGKGDILWRNTGNDLGIWFMNGTSIASSPTIGNASAAWSVASVGDYSGDGKSDILLRSSSNDVGIWFMNGSTVTTAPVLGNVGPSWLVQNAASN